MPNVALNATAGRPREEIGYEPTSFAELRPGCYDIHARVKDMDANGVLSALCFPQFVRFCGQIFTELGNDRDQARAMVQAYNDWHIDEWAGTYPGRIIPLAIPMLWDAEECAAEIRRVAAKGCHAMTFSASPYALGLPSIHTDYWDPVWKAAVDENLVIAMHLGSSSQQPVTSPDAPAEVVHTLTPITVYETATDIVWSQMFHKFPDLRVSLTEGGIGWIPYFLERIDYLYSYTKYFTGTDMGGKQPSEIFNEHVYLCFVVDGHGLESLHRMNIDNVMWECDYPHSTNTWPVFSGGGHEVHGRHPRRQADQQDHLGERQPGLLVGPVQAHPQGAGHRGGAAPAGHRLGREREIHHPPPPRRPARATQHRNGVTIGEMRGGGPDEDVTVVGGDAESPPTFADLMEWPVLRAAFEGSQVGRVRPGAPCRVAAGTASQPRMRLASASSVWARPEGCESPIS